MNWWAPAQSTLRIEYPADVLAKLRNRRYVGGILFGERQADALRIVAARYSGKPDPHVERFEKVGIFAVRARGEVFLTESDLQRLSELNGSVALVVAGSKAGFFVREPDGSIQAVRSYQEFPIAEDSPTRRPRAWIWGFALAACLVAAKPFFREPLPESLTVRRVAGQLQIGWNPAALAPPAELEILDGPQETRIPIQPLQESAFYTPLTPESDVRIFLLRGRETALVLGNVAAATRGP